MPDGLYASDALAWAEQQADLLSRLSAGERVNESIDWPNVIEEVRDVGLSQFHAVQSNLVQAFKHLLRLHDEPESKAASHWRGEVVGFLTNVHRSFAPSMRQRLDLDGLYADAVNAIQASAGRRGGPSIEIRCPFNLDELLVRPVDVAALVAVLTDARAV